MPIKSYYDLEFSVEPGGIRKDTHYVRGHLDDIRDDLAEELSHSLNGHLLCCGATLRLHIFPRGRYSHSIDLHPFVTIAVDGEPQWRFVRPDPRHREWQPVSVDGSPVSEEALDRLSVGPLDDGYRCTVDWRAIAVPRLPPPVVVAGDEVLPVYDRRHRPVDPNTMDPDARQDAGWIEYGFTDSEL